MNDADKLSTIIHPDFIQLPEAFSGLSFGRIRPRHITKPQSLLQVPNPNAVGENNYHAKKKTSWKLFAA